MFAFAINGMGGVSSYNLKRSVNGGETWNNIAITIGGAAFDFLDDNIGFLAEYNYLELIISLTDNGGTSWSEWNSTGFIFQPIVCNFYDEMNGLICGESNIIRTTDGGNSWEEVFIAGADEFVDIEYVNENEVFICGEVGSNSCIFKSVDGGLTWNNLCNFGNIHAHDLYFYDANTCFLTGINTIYRSSDGGNTWIETIINLSNFTHFKSIHFPTDEIGYAVGEGEFETIVKSTDGGENWNAIDISSTSGLNYVHFTDELNGLVFGDNGVVLKTTTGGVVGIEEDTFVKQQDFLQVFPNPFLDELFIKLNGSQSGGEISIYDQSGKVVYLMKVSNWGEKTIIDCGFLNPGVYFLHWTDENRISKSNKIIKL